MSIFELIANAINEDGVLPNHFHLPDEHPEGKGLKFAPGALDGIAFYHGLGPNDEEKEFENLISAIKSASDGDKEAAFSYAYEFADRGMMLHHIDNMQKYLIDNEAELNTKNIADFAIDLMYDGEKKEAVKLGLAILELFDTNQTEMYKEPIRLLAKYDEFTLSAAFHMRNWDNASREMFEAVKCVHDWGRIHIVRMWEPENEEMEEWLIKNGVKNGVAEYSGLDCFEKVHYMDRLKKDMSLEIYRGMSDILSDLLMEGPVPGISAIENKQELFKEFLNASKKRNDLDAADYRGLLDLMYYCEDSDENYAEFFDEIKQIFESECFAEKMRTALEKHQCLHMARELGFEYQPYAYEMVCEDCLENAWWASTLILDDYRADEIYEMMNKAIDLDKLASGSSDSLFPEGLYQGPDAAELILQALDEKVGADIPLVKAALLASVTRTRNRAINVIESWMKITSKPIDEISVELAEHIRNILDDEVVDDVKQRMINVLNNDIREEENVD